ncbi:MAG: VanW family protein, partial [Lachnospiraceae bacterium]|nr:VanW family protein [Lachnospiraceae bacterium]
DSFSLNSVLAPWTAEHGWFEAGTYVDGAVSNSLGGGICQVSSTLYNALLLAEIEIVERYPHSMSVGYVPLAADAALAGDYKDLVFRNNTDAPIYIKSIYNLGSITFKVYGHDTRPENRTVEYTSETVSTTPIEEEVEEDDSQPKDYEVTVSSGHTGYVAKLWKHVYIDGKEDETILVNTSTYRMTPKKVVRGTKEEEETTTEEETTKKHDNKDNDEKETKKHETDVEEPTAAPEPAEDNPEGEQ